MRVCSAKLRRVRVVAGGRGECGKERETHFYFLFSYYVFVGQLLLITVVKMKIPMRKLAILSTFLLALIVSFQTADASLT